MRIPVPTVPVSTQSVGQFSAPNVVPMQDATGPQLQNLGQSLQSAGKAATRIGADVQAELDQGFLMEADAIASEEVRKHVGELRQKAGLDAIESFEPLHRTLKDRLFNLRDSARSTQQRRAVDRLLAQRFSDASDAMVSHRDRAARDHAIGGAEASRLAAVNDYHAAIGNPEDMELARQIALDRTAELSRLRGEDGDMARLAMLDTTTRLHLGATSSLLQAGRSGDAEAYLAQWKGEMGAEDYAKAKATTRAAVIEDMARNAYGAADNFTDRKRFIDEAEDLTPKEQESAIRHLKLLQDRQDAIDADVAQDVERRALEWRATHPGLSIDDNPALAAEVRQYGVTLKRVTDERFLAAFEQATPEQFREWRSMTDAQLHREFAPFTDAHDEGRIMKVIRGDESGAKIDDHIKLLAKQIGLLPAIPYGQSEMREEESQKFLNWKLNTIGPMLQSLADELKRPPTPREVQERIVNPILEDRVWRNVSALGADWMAADAEMPLMRAQLIGAAPVDNPLTKEDEGADFSKYQDLYVNVGAERVMLRDIPLEVRESIRKTWHEDPAKRGRWLTVEQEAREWINLGRPGAAKPAAAMAPQDGQSGESTMADPLRFGGR